MTSRRCFAPIGPRQEPDGIRFASRRRATPRRVRRRGIHLTLVACVSFAAAALSAYAHAGESGEPTVIVLSWDGTRHDYPDRAPTPALDRMAREGLRASRLVPVFPSNTFPNHVSLATGSHPDRHGIVNNSFVDAERGRYTYSGDASWIDAEPIWVAAERQGRRAATFFWVGSETDWRGRSASYRRTPFDERIPESEKVDQILAWLDLPTHERPRLILSWWHGCDDVGHASGPAHADVETRLRAQDAELARLVTDLDARDAWSHTSLLIVSDHGMAEVSEMIDAQRVLEGAGIELEHPLTSGGMAYVELRASFTARCRWRRHQA